MPRSTLLAVCAALVAACTEPSPPVPAGLEFAVQPASTVTGASILVTVNIVDDRGRVVTSATSPVTIALGANPGSGVLHGTATVSAVNGVASFTNLTLDKAAVGYQLTASSPGLAQATSAAFTINAGPAARAVFLTAPTTAVAGGLLAAVQVQIQDLYFNPLPAATHQVSVALGSNPGGATLTGTLTVAAVNGVASFPDLRVDKIGTGYTLVASVPSLVPGISGSFNVTAGAPARLVFTVQPLTAPAGSALAPVIVALRDAGGNPATGVVSVTIALGANPGSSTLSGATTLPTVNAGTVSFANLVLSNPGTGYTLVASATGLTGATSMAFTIRTVLDFTAVSAGYFHVCGIVVGSVGHCWGENFDGKVGDGTTESRFFPVPVTNPPVFASLTLGRNHSCGLTPAGVAWCWGNNFVGQLGDGTTITHAAPTLVLGGLTFATLSAGYDQTCGVTLVGVAYCWGGNSGGELGDGTTLNATVPRAVAGGLTFLTISSGRFFTCGVTTANIAYCWGVNFEGELGNNSNLSSNLPVLVSGNLLFSTIGAGGFHACGQTTLGPIYCWGANQFGQLGNGQIVTSRVPVLVAGGLNLTKLSVNNRHNCALTPAGAAYCWGDNSDGKLGDGTTASRSAPNAVSGGLTFASVSAGRFHTCGVTTSNAAYCWGDNFAGQLGQGSQGGQFLAPTRVR